MKISENGFVLNCVAVLVILWLLGLIGGFGGVLINGLVGSYLMVQSAIIRPLALAFIPLLDEPEPFFRCLS